MKIKTNAESQILKLMTSLDNIGVKSTEKALRLAGLDAAALVVQRIEIQGMGVNGKLITKSKNADGVYSKGHKATRQKRGYQTNIVDLRMTGDLLNNYQLISSDSKTAEVGFNNQIQSDKANYLEAYYGELWSLTNKEEQVVRDTFEEAIFEDIRAI